VSENQINAIVPYDIQVNTSHQMLVRRGLTYSTPVPINVAQAQPAIFTTLQPEGNRAIVTVVRRSGNQVQEFLASPDTPATAGDTLVVYCAGLGPVNQALIAGSASPGDPPATTQDAVSLKLDGVDAAVSFAGLTPGFAGLYQVNAVVPSIASPTGQVALTIEVSGQVSSPAVITLR
jgi:uncharacterized protein (TIGR03437 family)